MIEEVAQFLAETQQARAAYSIPHRLRQRSEEFAHEALGLLFPQFHDFDHTEIARDQLWHLIDILNDVVHPLLPEQRTESMELCEAFARSLPTLRQQLFEDAEAIHAHDPASEGIDEVILAYPGFFAIAVYRIAHFFLKAGVPFFPRILTEFAHRETGIDIHPAAEIGSAFSIDHGTGVVIGATSTIGNRVRIFQGVTLGALSVKKELAATKRHPTIGDDVVIYANATILGGETVVGRGTVIGGNVWITKSVAPESVVTHSSALTRPNTEPDALLDYYL